MNLTALNIQTSTFLSCAYFVNAAYDLFETDPTLLNPTQSQYPSFPAGYNLLYNIQMTDFFGDFKETVYYGFVAQSQSNPGNYVLAIRGTKTYLEWWDDFHITPVPCPFAPNAGNVATGFLDLYNTMTMTIPGSGAAAVPLRQSTQPAAQPGYSLVGAGSLIVAGHSLGASLATLYATELAGMSPGTTIDLYTYASPRTGDVNFVQYFDSKNIMSYRIYNEPDIVPTVPFGFGYTQIPTGISIDSLLYPKVKWNLGCFHALVTYMYVLGGPASLLGSCLA
ncbi:MAG TPA: lipase family protein [Mucilaginibacter sp.]